MDIEKLTNGFHPELPKAYEKSVVLGGGRNLFPCHDPETTAKVLAEHVLDVARRAYRAGQRDARAKMRAALFD